MRLIRDDEFCTAAHRKQYKDRLGKALTKISEPEPPPAPVAGFAAQLPLQKGNETYSGDIWQFIHAAEPVIFTRPLPISISPLLGSTPYPTAKPTPADATALPRSLAPTVDSSALLRVPPLAVRAAVDSELAVPAAVTTPMPLLPAPAERMVFAIGAPVPVALTVGVSAPGFFAQVQAPAPAASAGHSLAVSTAPIESHFVTPNVNMAESAVALQMPRLELAAAEPHLAPVPVPQTNGHWTANPVTDSIYAAPADGTVEAEPLTQLPKFFIEAFEPNLVPPAQRQPRARWTPTAPEKPNHKLPAPDAADMPVVSPRLPKFHLPPMEAAHQPVQIPEACQNWMPHLQPEAVCVEVVASSAGEQLSLPEPVLPTLRDFSVTGTWMPFVMRLKPSLVAEPVSMRVWPKTAAVSLPVYDELPEIRVPETAALQTTDAGAHAAPQWHALPALISEPVECMVLPVSDTTLAEPAAERVLRTPQLFAHELKAGTFIAPPAQGLAAEPVETMPAVPPCVPAPLAARNEVCLPELSTPPVELPAIPASDQPAAQGVRVATRQPSVPPAPVEPLRTLFVVPPVLSEAEPPAASIGEHGFVPLDFYCQRNSGTPTGRMAWCPSVNRPILPGLSIHAIQERLDDAAPVRKKEGPGLAHIFALPEVARRKAGNKAVAYAIRALAAAMFLGAVLWFGAGALQVGSPRDVGDIASSVARSTITPGAAAAPGAAVRSATKATGVVARFRSAVADRAAASLTDSFRNGMEAWGTASKQFAPGWSRSADGYVRTGQLALFQPSLNFKDYHLEFFGQIENRGMGWAVRAKDTQNYYAMKLAVLDPGLRPVIAMVHYPVVGGKRGKPIEIPLNVMVHNNRPMQVDVEVRGSKLLTSVDGQLVDTWIDETLVAGGVGFFAEANERARLYWMRVSKNEDFLGRICAYVANTFGDGSHATAELWPTGMPPAPQPQPQPQPASQRPSEAALAATAVALQNRPVKDSRRVKWNS